MEKSENIMIRVSKETKAKIEENARISGMSVSSYLASFASMDKNTIIDTLTLKQAADVIKVSPSTLQKMCQQNAIKHMMVAGKYLFNKNDVEAYLKSNERDTDIDRKAEELGLPKLLTVTEAAAYWSVKDETVRTWIRSGKLVACQVGKNWRIKATDLERFAEAHTIRTHNTHKKR
jgi:excisionase family DNA binding protein